MQKPFTIEPVMIVAKAVEPIFPGQINLCLPHFGQPQIIKTKIRRQVWLVVAGEKRPRFHNVGPFNKPFSPPHVVFRDRVKLWEIKGNRAYRSSGHRLMDLLNEDIPKLAVNAELTVANGMNRHGQFAHSYSRKGNSMPHS